MKRNLCFGLIIMCIFSFISFAIEPYVMRLNMQDDYQSIQFNKLDFGIHPLATTGLDTSLGERELPPFIPPDGLHGVFLIDDSVLGNNLWSYLDLMPIPKGKKDSIVFKFEVHNIVQALNFSWLPLPSVVDSAFIRDRYTGNIIKISLKDSLSAKVINKSITKFEIVVWFDVTSNIEDLSPYKKISLSPNPSSDFLLIQSDAILKNYEIYNEIGERVGSDIIENSNFTLRINDLIDGLYFIKLYTIDGKTLIKKFVKFK